jgi:hypothetical protein
VPDMLTTFPRLLLEHAPSAAQRACHARKRIWHLADDHSWARLGALVEHVACGLHQAGLRRGEHMVIVGANRPRLYATMLAAQSLGAIPVPLYQDAVAAEFVFPINNADVRLRRGRRPGAGRQDARASPGVHARWPAHLVRRSAWPAQLPTSAGLVALDTIDGSRPPLRRRRMPASTTQQVAAAAGPTTWRRCSSPVGNDRRSERRGAHAFHADRPRAGRRRASTG